MKLLDFSLSRSVGFLGALLFLVLFGIGEICGCNYIRCLGSAEDFFGKGFVKLGEKVIVGFKVKDSNSVVVLVTSNADPDYLVFRMGKENDVEIDYPKVLLNSWSRFSYNYYVRGGSSDNDGLDLNKLIFNLDGQLYKIFENYFEGELVELGLRVVDLKKGNEKNYYSLPDSVVGSLIILRDGKRAKVEAE